MPSQSKPPTAQITHATTTAAFAGDVPVGKHSVEVHIYVEGPKTPGKYGGEGAKMNTAPQKYWGANTAFSATVEAGGANDFKFDMSSRGSELFWLSRVPGPLRVDPFRDGS